MVLYFRQRCESCNKGRVSLSLILALAVSIGIHFAVLFGSEMEKETMPEIVPILAELKPQPRPQPVVVPTSKPERPVAIKKKPRQKSETIASATPVLAVPEQKLEAPSPSDNPPAPPPSTEAASEAIAPTPEAPEEPVVAPVEPRLPPRGIIHYRVDRGESNFEIGRARQEWEIGDGYYRLSSVIETTGLAWLLKAYRVEMESIGSVTSDGLRPDYFSIRRNGKEAREHASFDWQRMTVQVGKRPEQVLSEGAQDLLSFNYQLGFMSHAEAGSLLPLATGKKYTVYQLQVLGDEEIDVPAGEMRTLHLRAPGDSPIDLWLAYDYLLLPVKIRFVESDGDVYVQVATQIQTSPP